jgi:hypothetical protein
VTSFLAWVAFPLGAFVLCTAVGLLVERLARALLPDGLLAPVGACTAIVLTLPVYMSGGSAPAAAAVLVVAALAGAILGRRRRPAAGWWAPVAAGVAIYALYLAPVALTGHWTWAGYNFVNDTSVNLVMVDHVMAHGDAFPPAGVSTTQNIVIDTLAAGYPLGVHALLGTLAWLMPVTLAAVYQPFIALLAALAAMALAELARGSRAPAVAAAGAAVVALGANLTFHYALHGAFKEIALVMALATAAAAARAALDARLATGHVLVMALPLASMIALLSGVAVAYILVLGGLVLVAGAVLERAGVARIAIGLAAGVAVIAVAVLPYVREATQFAVGAGETFSSTSSLGGANSTAVLGHLLRPLPAYQGLGTWIRDDYRYPLEPGSAVPLTTIALVVTGLLAATCVVMETIRRRWAATLAAVPGALVYAVAEPRLSPYAEAKLLVIASPLVVFAAALGAIWLFGRIRAAGALAAAIVVVGIGVSDALAYHYAQLAPTDRMEALTDAAEHTGRGAWLFTEWEEFAKYFGRDARLNVAPESFSPRAAELRKPGPIFARTIDLDDMKLAYVESWAGVVLRRGPDASRPPANFSLAYQNAYYQLWRRGSGPEVLEHLPVTSGRDRAGFPNCAAVRGLASRVKPGERLVAAKASRLAALDTTRAATAPKGWNPGFDPGVVVPFRPGVASGALDLPAGRYRVWVRASTGRTLHVAVDGREIGAVRAVNTPGQSLLAGTVELPSGRHEVVLRRPGGDVYPGDGFRGEIGRVAFEPVAPEPLVTVAQASAASLCRGEWDWIERVRG